MTALAAEHLILLVAAVIVVNRAFDSTGLKRNRHAYAVVQVFDLSMVVVLFVSRMNELPPKADFAIRVFLMLFVAWHMVRNNQARIAALRGDQEEVDEREARRERFARAAAMGEAQAQARGEASGDAEEADGDAD